MHEIEYIQLSEITPYEHNPRKNEKAVGVVAESLKAFGAQNPIILDKDNVIIAGHTRYLAAQQIGMTDFPCIVARELTEEQVKAYRLADNKTGEFAEWDDDLLTVEIAGILDIDMSLFGFENPADLFDDNPYTMKGDIPQYEVTGEIPEHDELVSSHKTERLVNEIEACEDISEEEREFLLKAATRHYEFNFKKIAEYYANVAGPEMQRLMERSALVIIDFDNAIANGYVKLANDIAEMLAEDLDDGDEG